MKITRLISRIIVGLVFIFSGFVKAVDPLGSAYKFYDYFHAFHIDFLKILSLPLAIMLFTAEFITGIAVLSGLRQKTGIIGAFILILFFTPLTLILALTNPVSDCGCFGDAVHLTNWETFLKNLVLFILILFLFTGRKTCKDLFRPFTEWILVIIVTALFILFSFYNLRHLPLIDFLPYKTGTNIPEKMMRPEGAPSDQYAATFIYEKDGKQKEFTINNYPANDTTWKFIEQKSQLIKRGYKPPIHDFSIVSAQNENITDIVLRDTSYSVLMISKKLSEASGSNLSAGFDIGRSCLEAGINFYILTASGNEEINKYKNGLKLCNMDETTLKTMMRANPGYLLIKGGTIVGKWSWADTQELCNLLKNKTGISIKINH